MDGTESAAVSRGALRRGALVGLLGLQAVDMSCGTGPSPGGTAETAGEAGANSSMNGETGTSGQEPSTSHAGTTGAATDGTTGGTGVTTGAATTGGTSGTSGGATGAPELEVELRGVQTIAEIGAGQGVDVRDGRVYLFGDRADVGVIREYAIGPGDPPTLAFTGLEVTLTVGDAVVAAHPTGLTSHPTFGTFLGNTVAGEGTILRVDWPAMLAQGSLDGALLQVTIDDLAIDGARPEFVRSGDDWLIATADYGDQGNEVRLYDPAALTGAAATSEAGVLVARLSSGTFVQSLHWLDAEGLLLLVQNQSYGARWRLSLLDPWAGRGGMLYPAVDLAAPTDELEGFHGLPDGALGVFVSSAASDNVRVAGLTVK